MNYTPIVQDTSLPKAIICDIDGTLTRLGVRYDAEGNETTQGVRGKYEYERVGEDVLNEVNASFINKLNRDGFGEPFYCSIIYSTGRPTSSLNYTCKWLRKNIGILEDDEVNIYMRLEESGDKAPSHSVKRANLELICKEYNVILALDDSSQDVDMYRQSGINTWQVADNNF